MLDLLKNIEIPEKPESKDVETHSIRVVSTKHEQKTSRQGYNQTRDELNKMQISLALDY